MKTFQQFLEESNSALTLYRSGRRADDNSLEARRKEAFAKSKEQLRRAQQKPDRPKVNPVKSVSIKSKTPNINVAKTVTSVAKAAVKKLRSM